MAGRDVAGLQDAEKITITLQMEGKSICVESVETGPASRTVRCEEELISFSFCKLLFPCHHYCHY